LSGSPPVCQNGHSRSPITVCCPAYSCVVRRPSRQCPGTAVVRLVHCRAVSFSLAINFACTCTMYIVPGTTTIRCRRQSMKLQVEVKLMIFVFSRLDYCNALLHPHGVYEGLMCCVQTVPNTAVRLVTGKKVKVKKVRIILSYALSPKHLDMS